VYFVLKEESVFHAATLEFREQMVALARGGRSVESLSWKYDPCAVPLHNGSNSPVPMMANVTSI